MNDTHEYTNDRSNIGESAPHITHGGEIADPGTIQVPGAPRAYSRKKLLFVLLLPLLMSLMQVGSVNTVLNTMQVALNATDTQIQWIISGYSLVIGITLVPSGRIGDIFGRSSTFIVGLAVFSVSSLAIGCAANATAVNLLRIAQGIGAGILSPQINGLIQEHFTGKARARAFALMGLVIAVSFAAGPVMSGATVALFGDSIGWRMSFWLNFPLGIIGIILSFFWLPFGKERRTIGAHKDEAQQEYEEREKQRGRTPAKRVSNWKNIDLDPVGMLILCACVVCMMLPFMISGSPWRFLLCGCGIILLALWVLWEKNYKARGKFPQVDLSLFSIETYSYCMAVSAIQFLGMTSIWVVLSMFFQSALGASALVYALISLPNALISAVTSVWSGKYTIEHGRAIQAISLVVYTVGVIGCIALAYPTYHGASVWWYIIPTLVMGIGGGSLGSANQTQSMLDVPVKEGGTAGGVFQTAQRMTTAIGIAIITAVFFAVRGSGEPPAGDIQWFFGLAASLGVSALFLTIATIVAFVFWRKQPKETRAAQ